MLNKMRFLRSWSQHDDSFVRFSQSLLEVIVVLACAIILLALIGIFTFVGVQGGRYFLPMSAYEVRILFTQTDEYAPNEGVLTKEVKTEYVLSHLSIGDLTDSLQQKLDSQYLARNQTKPKALVTPADNLYLLTTQSGKRYVGEFVSLQDGEHTTENLNELNALKSTVERLQQNLHEIQILHLAPLHKEISDLNNKDVAKETPLYERKIDDFTRWQTYANDIIMQIDKHKINFRQDSGEIVVIGINDLRDIYQPNKLTWWQSIGYSLNQVYVFLTDSPKNAGTSGGVFPAIFGTLLMVLIMALLVTPFGAISAIYLHEYAPDNKVTASIRICVSNMAAVPSVVYGVFGLGFFVYTLGGSLDSLFYADKLPSPTFGSPGLLWASLTMGILTLPVVIVATEEGLRRVPNNLRTGALALGASKYETIVKVVLPMASPGILTGVILAIARAAGEVAPLILVGAVKFAPTLPIDNEFPYVHLERQFMHLGVFVYDGAFHNQTESQTASLMFATCMLLLIIVLLLNLSAIMLRNKLRNKYERF